MSFDVNLRHEPLVVTTRGDAIENVHCGSIAVVDATGRLLHSAGDPQATVFTRSTLKAFQALPLMLDGGDRTLGFDDREVALLAASHSGEPMHVEAVDGILSKSGAHRRELKCGCHVPYVFATLGQPEPPLQAFDQRHHNCSGKHAGFLAYCRLHDLPTDSYLEFDHPLQRRIKRTLAELLALPESAMPTGVDGCSAPNHALPLAGLARLWAMLAAGAGSDPLDAAFARLRGAMLVHPPLVSGTGRSDLAFASAGAGDWLAKGGADGVQVFGIRSRGIGVALKIGDGSSDARAVAAFDTLRQLGLCGPDDPDIGRYARMPITNIAGLHTGWIQPAFRLRPH